MVREDSTITINDITKDLLLRMSEMERESYLTKKKERSFLEESG